jgi:adenylate kinase family enzyme
MIVEFIGSTAAGKTTLAAEVQQKLNNPTQVVRPLELIIKRLGWQKVTNKTIQNLIQDFIAFPFFILSLFKYRTFLVFALKSLARHANYTLHALNYIRSIIRRIGMYEMAQKYKRNRIMLVDEGLILSAYLLFVYTRNAYSQDEIDTFARLIPLPELVVYIRVPVDMLVRRSLQRDDVRKELRSVNKRTVKKHISSAVKMFEQLIETKEIQDKVLIVTNMTSNAAKRNAVADGIARHVLNFTTE